MRTRGASTRQLAVLALADALLVVLLGTVGAVLLAPLLSTAVAGSAGLELGAGGVLAALTSAPLWWAVGPMALLATLVIVTTTLRVGRVRDGTGSRQSGRVVRLLTGSGLDVLLVGLGALAVVQLRRYDAAGSTTVDPLTTAAPAVVIAGLSVLCLRLLPLLTRQVARLTGEARGLEPAWGGWQLSRRLAGQVGTVLLVLLAVAMGTLALSHSATADRALQDQSAFEAGAPVRVVVGPGASAAPPGRSSRRRPVAPTGSSPWRARSSTSGRSPGSPRWPSTRRRQVGSSTRAPTSSAAPTGPTSWPTSPTPAGSPRACRCPASRPGSPFGPGSAPRTPTFRRTTAFPARCSCATHEAWCTPCRSASWGCALPTSPSSSPMASTGWTTR